MDRLSLRISAVLFATILCISYLTPSIASGANAKSNANPAPSASLKTATNPTSNVGTLTGNFQVTPAGQAHYSIPIDVPPGTAKMQPALAVSYDSTSSNTHNGILGMGFSLEGLTAITRCPSNKSQNEGIHGVDFTYKDRFCLNGEQLVAINGNYGAEGTEYRTYNDSQARIISYGHIGDGPASFKVWTKGGQVASYGTTTNSQIYAQGKPTIATWALNQVTDSVGNYLMVSYIKDDANGAFYPLQISYTANDAAHLTAHNSVVFSYEPRPDKIEKYTAGSVVRILNRLKDITVKNQEKPVSVYHLNYEISKNTYRSRMTSMQKCGADGVCLPPTKFEWQTNDKGWGEASYLNLPDNLDFEGKPHGELIDINGDGVTDLVISEFRGGLSYRGTWINTGTSWYHDPNLDLLDNLYIDGTEHGQLIDINGDGLPDLIVSDFRGGQQYRATTINTGHSWYYDPNFALLDNIYLEGHQLGQFVDINGDGLPDFVVSAWLKGTQYRNTQINTGHNFYADPNYNLLDNIYLEDRQMGQFVDINGDGLPDFVVSAWLKGTQYRNTQINTGHNFYADPSYNILENIYLEDRQIGQFVDINGSGLPGFVVSAWLKGTQYRSAQINTGHNFYADPSYNLLENIYLEDRQIGQFVDVNGDGMPDFVVSALINGTQYRSTQINTGHGWFADTDYNLPDNIYIDKTTHGHFADLTGYGIPAFIVADFRGGVPYRGVWLNRAKKFPDYLIAITDGLGSKTTIDYEPLSGKIVNVYTNDRNDPIHAAKYPNMDWQGPMYVVYQTISDANISDPKAIARVKANSKDAKNALNHVTTYHYTGAKFNHLGWGFLGFRQVEIKDDTTGIKKIITYGQDPNLHNIGQELSTETRTRTNELIHYTSSTWNFRKTHGDGSPNVTSYFSYVSNAQENGYDLSGNLLSIKTIETIFDDYANPTQIIETIRDPNHNGSYATQTVNSYNNIVDSTHWILGELMRSTVTATAPNTPNETHTSAFTYDTNGLLASETTEPDDAALKLTKTYTRGDAFSNITKTEITNADKSIDRVTTTQYDATGAFVVIATNALGQMTHQVSDPRFGKPVATEDLNGLETIYQYDGLGRLVLQTNPDKTTMQEQFYWTPTPPADAVGAVYAEEIDITGRPSVIKYYDQLNRMVAKSTKGFDGRNVWDTTQYDELDRITRSSLPYYEGEPRYYNLNSYDILGRLIQTNKADGGVITIVYDGLTTTTYNPNFQKLIKVENVRGKIIQSTDNNGKSVFNKYDAYGRLIAMVDSQNNITTMTYNKLGNKLSEDDPDKGKYTYEYDAFGEVTKQTDAIGNVITFKYDNLGRMVARTDGKGTSTWEYGKDVSKYNVGLLIREEGIANITKNTNGEYTVSPADINTVFAAQKNGLETYSKTISYDRYARPQFSEMKVKGDSITTQTQYDTQGRVATIIYNDKLIVQNVYNSFGYLSTIKNGVATTGAIYWQVNAMDANGNVISETHSNGLLTRKIYDPASGFLKEIHTTLGANNKLQEQLFGKLRAKKKNRNGTIQSLYYNYDKIGNLMSRDDQVNNIHESFAYDSLNRITNWTATGSMPRTKGYQYDELGNMIYQSGLGRYDYHGEGAGPHAVTKITDDGGKVVGRFTYDKDGNQIISAINDKTRFISYTSFEKPLTIHNDNAQTDFYYNANRDLVERVDQFTKDGKSFNIMTVNCDNYEREYYNDGVTLHTRDKIYVGPYTEVTIDGSGSTSFELLKDNLGSLIDITDQIGNVVRSYHYEPFGKQELIGQYQDVIPPLTHHGFTGHQSIESFALIHMAGRIYDPIIARFLSADPYIQDPTNTQSLNRYSYCINNPLAYTDPSGFGFWHSLFHSIGNIAHDVGHVCMNVLENKYFQMAVGISMQFIGCPGWAIVLTETSYSIFNTAIAGGGFNDMLRAAGAAWIGLEFQDFMNVSKFGSAEFGSAGWFAGVTASSLEGGGVRVLEGGSFQDGFISGAIMQTAAAPISKMGNYETPGMLLRSAATGIVGGTVAAITGGHFGEAAKMSSFAYLYTDSLSATMIKGKGATKLTDVMYDGKAYPVARDIKWGPLAFLPIPIYPFIHSALYIPLGNGNYRLPGAAPEAGTGIPQVTGNIMIDDDVIHGYDLSDYVVLNIPGTEGGLDASRVMTIVTQQMNDWSYASNPAAARYNLFTHNCHDLTDDTIQRYMAGA